MRAVDAVNLELSGAQCAAIAGVDPETGRCAAEDREKAVEDATAELLAEAGEARRAGAYGRAADLYYRVAATRSELLGGRPSHWLASTMREEAERCLALARKSQSRPKRWGRR